MKLINENKNISVSICIITYNQEEYIGKVLDYLINQKTDFRYEIIIGEDCSQDSTRDICLQYQKRYPELINLILQKENLGLIGNFTSAISECQGKYIALCAGDDFWIDELKIQKQVQFLEDNPDFSMCSTEAYYNKTYLPRNLKGFLAILYYNLILDGFLKALNLFLEFFSSREEFWKKRRLIPKIKRPEVGSLATVLNDLLSPRYYAASANIVRRQIFENIPQEAYKQTSEHIIVILWSALHGKIKLLKDVTMVKNDILTSISATNLMQKHFGKDNEYNNYINLLKLALKQNIEENHKFLLDKKIKDLQELNKRSV